jgi:uncharacterized repeat protein (TIGR01451 family)
VGLSRRETVFGKRLALAFAAFAAAALAFVFLAAGPAWAQAVLDVEKVDEPDVVKSGEEITYTITVDNTGNADADDVTLTDTLPTQVDFVSAETEDGDCTEASGVVTCDLSPIGPDDDPITVTIIVAAQSSGLANNTVEVTATGVAVPGADTEETTIVPDLDITKFADSRTATVGTSLLYTLRIENLGGGTANNVTIRDVLPDSVRFISAESTDFDECEDNRGIVVCRGGTIDVGDFATVEINVAPREEGTIENTAAVGATVDGETVRNIDKDTTQTEVVNGGGTTNGGGSTNGGGTTGGGTGNGNCAGASTVETFTGTEDNDQTSTFEIKGDAFRVTAKVTATDESAGTSLDVGVRDESANGSLVGSIKLEEAGSDTATFDAGPGRFSLDIDVENGTYEITVEDCLGSTSSGTTGTGTTDGNDGTTTTTTTGTSTREEVIRSTIPKGVLADTGGPSGPLLLMGAALLLAGAATWTFRRFY